MKTEKTIDLTPYIKNARNCTTIFDTRDYILKEDVEKIIEAENELASQFKSPERSEEAWISVDVKPTLGERFNVIFEDEEGPCSDTADWNNKIQQWEHIGTEIPYTGIKFYRPLPIYKNEISDSTNIVLDNKREIDVKVGHSKALHEYRNQIPEGCKCEGGPKGRTVTEDFEHQICDSCGKLSLTANQIPEGGELSDEEIKKGAQDYEPIGLGRTDNIDQAKHSSFIQGAEWYRERLSSLSKGENKELSECVHPFASVISKCNGEINTCLKCGKTL